VNPYTSGVHTPLYFSFVVFLIQGVSMSTTLSYIFLGGAVCNKCLSENVMLCSVNTGCEQWYDKFYIHCSVHHCNSLK